MVKRILNFYHGISDGPKKVLHNMNWLFWDNIMRMGVNFFVGIAIARYFGPENYGIFNYAFAFAFLFTFLTSLGLENVAIRELVNRPDKNNEIMGSVFIMKLIGSLSAIFIVNGISYFLHGYNSSEFKIIFILSLGFIYQAFSILSLHFSSKVEGKYNVISVSIGFVVSTILKLLVIYFGKSIIYLAYIILIESIIHLISYLYVYKFLGGGNILKWKIDKVIIKKFLKEGIPLSIAGIAGILYARIDQIIIGKMLGNIDVGYYSVAVTLSEAPIFLATIISSSLFPAIISSRKMGDDIYRKRLKLYLSLMSIVSLSIVLVVFIFSSKIILLLFGNQYINSISILQVYIWSLLGIYFGMIINQFLVIENKIRYVLYSTIIGCALNILLNYLLIPHYGLIGAAYATVIPFWLSLIIFFCFNETRDILLFSFKFFNPYFLVRYVILKK